MNVNPVATEVNDPRILRMPADLRERILDAATEVLVEEGLDARLHARIAERAGLSRPTVYKHVGDQSAIFAAVLDREVSAFLTAAIPVLGRSDDLGAGLVDAIVFVVKYARGHALLQKALREHPELILPALTTGSGPLMDRLDETFGEQVARSLAQTSATVDPRTVVEWAARVTISLITTPSAVRTETDADLRNYVSGLVDLAHLVAPVPQPGRLP